jgi:membrane-bound transcription factor site-1 protease
VIVAADWYNVDVMRHIKFFDENTKQWWTPVTGGANVPALNELLGEFGIALGDDVVRGDLLVGDRVASYASGSTLRRFPAGGALLHATLINETAELLADAHAAAAVAAGATHKPPVLGVMRYGGEWAAMRGADVRSGDEGGVVAVLGDASCLDDSHHTSKRAPCYWLLDILLEIATQNAPLSLMLPAAEVLTAPLAPASLAPVRRLDNSTLARISSVIDRQPQCESIMWHRVDASLRIDGSIYFATARTAETTAPTAPAPTSAPPRKRALDGALATLRWAPQLPFWSFYAPYLAGAIAGSFIVLVSSASATAAAVSKNQ